MKTLGVIPVRYGSTRFPGKPLQLIGGKYLFQWVVEAALQSSKLNQVAVATDDQRIFDAAEKLGVNVYMTSPHWTTGTDRVWSVAQKLAPDIVINIQGDEPLITPEALDQLALTLIENPACQIATLGCQLNQESLYSHNTAKIIVNHLHEAIYFSRFPVPFFRKKLDPSAASDGLGLKHVGIYAFRYDFLRQFCEHGVTPLEEYEGLEQLRALYLGARIKVVETALDSWGVDTPEDVKKIERMLEQSKVKHGH